VAGAQVICCVCGCRVDPIWHSFRYRRQPYNHPFSRSLYFSDPFMGGDDVNFCSAMCSNSYEDENTYANKESGQESGKLRKKKK
jgi:hypothetical protein